MRPSSARAQPSARPGISARTKIASSRRGGPLNVGLDVVIDGRAVMVVDNRLLQRVAAAYESKYGSDWHFDVVDGAFLGDGGTALVFEVKPSKAFGFARGEYSQTRWAF